jgi:transglutaminase-like putative cysteine protease
VPLSWDAEGGSLSDTLQLRRERPVDRRLAWRGRSVASGKFLDPRTPAVTQLMVGEARNPRTAALGRILRARSGSDRAYLQSILGWFRREAFYYTLSPPALGSSPVDDFLFRTRSGFCEHYASAFAVLARAGGIPARVVAGYQGGERNPLGDYWIVRQSDAHAWTEVWLEGRWLRIDPTAAVAPQRIEAGLEAALPEQVTSGLPLLGQTAWLERLALGWDALNATWDRWVLAFGPDQQTALLERLGFRTPTLRELALVCAVSVSLFLLVYTALGLRPRRNRPEPVEQAWQRLCTRLGRATRPRSPGETATDYAAAVARARPELGPALRAVAELYLALRYEPGSSPAELRRFLDLSCRLRVEGR